MLSNQMNKACEELREVSSNVRSFQKKISSKAEDLRIDILRVMRCIEEDRNYGVEGVTKEVRTFKEKISGALTDFKKLLDTFEDKQCIQFKLLLDSITKLLDLLAYHSRFRPPLVG